MLKKLTTAFGGVSDPTRVRLLSLLLHRDEICVCDLVDATGLTQTNVSRHLATLRNAGLIQSRKEGLWVYYSIKQPESDLERSIIKTVKSAAEESRELKKDLEKLKVTHCAINPKPLSISLPKRVVTRK